jgi:hypothetical protein
MKMNPHRRLQRAISLRLPPALNGWKLFRQQCEERKRDPAPAARGEIVVEARPPREKLRAARLEPRGTSAAGEDPRRLEAT